MKTLMVPVKVPSEDRQSRIDPASGARVKRFRGYGGWTKYFYEDTEVGKLIKPQVVPNLDRSEWMVRTTPYGFIMAVQVQNTFPEDDLVYLMMKFGVTIDE